MSDKPVVAYRYIIAGQDFWVRQRDVGRAANGLREIREMSEGDLLDLQLPDEPEGDTANSIMNALLTYAETDDTVYVGGNAKALRLDGSFDVERLAAILARPQPGQDND